MSKINNKINLKIRMLMGRPNLTSLQTFEKWEKFDYIIREFRVRKYVVQIRCSLLQKFI